MMGAKQARAATIGVCELHGYCRFAHHVLLFPLQISPTPNAALLL
jgi:hypothetical protein